MRKFWMIVLGGLASAGVWAQEAVPATESAGQAIKDSMTFIEVYRAGGWLMYPITVMSMIAVALIVFYIIVLRLEFVIPSKWYARIRELILEGRLEEARSHCMDNASPVSAIASVALDHARAQKNPEIALLKELMEGEGLHQATKIQNRVQYLYDIAVITPMMGLLGTVVGMLQAFNAVALDLAKAKPMLLAAGVSLALITTVAGLVVAIPAMMAYSYFRNRASSLVGQLETASADLLTLLAKH